VKHRLLDLLCCPQCRGDLTLDVFQANPSDAGQEIVEGKLNCASCSAVYPIIGGVPRMLCGTLLTESLTRYHGEFLDRYRNQLGLQLCAAARDKKTDTMHAFGYQWTTFVDNFGYYREMFLSFVRPYLDPEQFKGRTVLDVGCGSGRPASVACSFGAEVIGVDLSEAVQTAHAQSRKYPRLHVVQADIYALPFRPIFDFAYCVGVLQHLPNPAEALRSIARIMPAGHRLVLWVYGKRERWYDLIEWARTWTRRMSYRPLHALSWLFAVLSEIFLLVPYRILARIPLTRRLAERIPGRIYAQYPFQENVVGWFDRLSAPVTYYFTESDVTRMLSDAGFVDSTLVSRPDASASWVVQTFKGATPAMKSR